MARDFESMAIGVETSRVASIPPIVGGVDVWLAETGPAFEAGVLDRCRELLTEEERAAARSFRRESDRRRAVVSRALLRTTLSRYAAVDPAAWRFERGPLGRPEIAGPDSLGLRFSLSHASGLVACAVADGAAVGVDVEPCGREVDDLLEADAILSPSEIESLRRLPSRERPARFLELWTLKEAWAKALGTGLASEPSTLAFDLDRPGPIAGPRGHEGWFALQRVAPDHVLAIALERGGPPARVRTFLAESPSSAFRPLPVRHRR